MKNAFGPPGCPEYAGSFKGMTVELGQTYQEKICKFPIKDPDGKQRFGRRQYMKRVPQVWEWDGKQWFLTK